MKKVLSILLLLPAFVGASEQRVANYSYKYDLDSTNVIYCSLVGQSASAYGPGITGVARILTSGSSTTVSAVTAGTNPFADLGVGDVIAVRRETATDVVYITAKASADSVTVDTAVDWGNSGSGRQFTWLDLRCGTAITDGWIDVAGTQDKKFSIEYNAGDSTVDVRLECMDASIGASPVVAYPGEADTCGSGGTLASGYCQFAAGGVGITNRLSIVSYEPWSKCRLGIKINGADASDAGANLEQISAYVTISINR